MTDSAALDYEPISLDERDQNEILIHPEEDFVGMR